MTLPARPKPFQSGWIVVALLLGLVYVPPAVASSVAGAGLADVPLFVHPDSWSLVNFSDVLSGRVIVPTLPAESYAIVAVCESGSVICVSWPPEA